MSHVTTMELEIKDLEALKDACKMLGLEFVVGQKTFKWYGVHVGDYPLPTGFTKEDMGKCIHAIRIPGNPSSYEIGVAERRDGQTGYVLLWDFWAGGFGLQEKVGKEGGLMKQAYAIARAKREALKMGYRTQVQKNQKNGNLLLKMYN